MTFQIQQPTLNRALQICSKALNDNNVLPINSYFLFEIKDGMLNISACDMRIIIGTSIPIIADTIRICIPGRKLADYVAKTGNEVMTFEFTDNMVHGSNEADFNMTLTIKTKAGKCQMACEPGDDFPQIKNVDPRSFELPAEDFLEVLYKTMFAISDDQLRPSMTGLNCAVRNVGMCFTSTDGHRIATYTYPSELNFDADFIIPKKALQQIQSLSPVGKLSCSISKSAISIDFGDIKTTSLLIDEVFPDYLNVTPVANDIDMLTSRTALIASLKRILPFADAGKLVKLDVRQDELILTAANIDYNEEANETIPCVGGAITIGVNGEYLLAILASLVDDKIWFSFSDPKRAIIITESERHVNPGKDNLVLLMPVFI